MEFLVDSFLHRVLFHLSNSYIVTTLYKDYLDAWNLVNSCLTTPINV
jgi:hypothetical protein